ncbi:hypothetical protein NIES2104_53400 [Leptolyngbya sp. NIES-2104]|nr:hypothetical protein NIES2104_53400 [Leptolyngbya sp. NIES-2104]
MCDRALVLGCVSELFASFMSAPEWNSGLTVRSQLKLTEDAGFGC